MKTRMKKIVLFPVLILTAAVLIYGCETSKITNVWRDSAYSNGPMKHVLVLCVWKSKVQRRLWEDAFVQALYDKGVDADPSYRTYPDAVPDEKEISGLFNNKYDGVLLLRKVSEKVNRFYMPGDYFPGWYGGPFYRRYSMAYSGLWAPGYIEDETLVQFETSVWEPGEDGNMIWGAVTETVNPTSFKELRQDIMKLIIPKLSKSGILPGMRKSRAV